jgi:peptidoglycan/LPS O-acetylase OafA/YrhL
MLTGAQTAHTARNELAAPTTVPYPKWSTVLASRAIPSLNGIRGTAAMAVVFGHIQRKGAFVLPDWIRGYAVTCFFVLSGFLITNLLVRERAKSNTVSLKDFYYRRTLRIFPAFYVFCALFLAIFLVQGRLVQWPAYLAAVFYISDYYMALHGIGSVMTHTWSLAIEEQFYLIWPFVFKHFAVSRIAIERLLIAAIVSIWIYRPILEYHFHVPWYYIYCAFETRADALAIGCLMAVLADADRLPAWLTERKWLGLVAVLTIVTIPYLGPFGGLIGWPLIPICFGVVILHAVRFYNAPAYRWLNWGFMQRLGLWSYSIYLYHVLTHRIVPDRWIWVQIPLNLALAVALGAGSYYAVEKPFLALRDHGFQKRGRPKAIVMA